MKVSTRHLSNRYRSRRDERELAAAVGGRVQPASGALPVASLKGDVVTADWLFDSKVTRSQSFSVSLKLWNKLRKQAFKASYRKPAIRIAFEDADETKLVVLSQADFIRLINQGKP